MKIILRIFFWVMFITLMGCHIDKDFIGPAYVIHETHPTPLYVIPVYIDDNFTIKDKEAIKVAVKNWNESLCGYLVLKISSTEFKLDRRTINLAEGGKVYLILKTYSSNPIISSRDHANYIALGLANKVGGNWLWIVRDRLDDSDIINITMHELGHLLGAEHTPRYLMSPNYSKIEYQCIDKSAIQQVADKWSLPMSKLSYCVYND
jgi:hypothetical protein